MNTHQTGTNLNGIDAIKLFAACMVVLLHSTETFQVYLPSLVTHTFCELAVPFFFLASGYLFATGLETGKPSERMRKSTCKLVKLYAFWGIIALGPFLIYDYLNMDKYANASGAYMFLILMRRFFIAGAGPYWYLLGLLLSFFIIYPIRNKTRLLFILAASTLSLTIMYESFREHSSNILGLAQMCECLDFMYSGKNNFLTLGIPFTTIGYLIRKTNFHLPKHLAMEQNRFLLPQKQEQSRGKQRHDNCKDNHCDSVYFHRFLLPRSFVIRPVRVFLVSGHRPIEGP